MSSKVLSLVMLSWVLVSCHGSASKVCSPVLPTPVEVDSSRAQELLITGDTGSTLGIYDPAVWYPAGASSGAMSYSSVPSATFPADQVFTRVAVSSDAGASWSYVADVNSISTITVNNNDSSRCGGGQCTGKLIHEVSTIVNDADDPDSTRRWKVFAHSYLAVSAQLLYYDYGFIGLWTAPAPQGPWSSEIRFIGWSSPTSDFPSTGSPRLLASTTSGLSNCLLFTEPSALYRSTPSGGLIDLAVTCVSLGSDHKGHSTTVLLRSSDHGATVQFVGNMLTPDDGSCLGSSVSNLDATNVFQSSNLFVAGGNEYLIQTPQGTDGLEKGCWVYAVDDPSSGKIRRDSSGVPVVLRRFTSSAIHSGACTYGEGATAMGGYLFPQLLIQTNPSKPFHIFKTGVPAP